MSRTSSIFGPQLLTYTAWWGFWAIFQTVILHRLGLDWSLALIDAALSITILSASGWAISNTYRFYRPGDTNFLYRFGMGFALAAVGTIAHSIWIHYVYRSNTSYIQFYELSQPIRFAFFILMNACMGVVNWLRHYIRDQEQSQLRKAEAEQLLREAELSRLRQQLQPHFLFNSLNSISALAGSQPQQARTMIQQLSDFLRGTLKKDENQLVPLKEELQHIQLYLEIEKVRFGHRLQTELIQDVPCENCKLPSLLLQPIIENAIKFGLYDTTESVMITIRVSESDGFLTVSVRNPFDITTSKPRQGTGFGLSAIQRRLYLIYGRTDLIKTEMANNHFETTLLIPQQS